MPQLNSKLMGLGVGVLTLNLLAVDIDADDGLETKKGLLYRAARLFDVTVKDKARAEAVYTDIVQLDPSDEIALIALDGVRKALGKYAEIVESLIARSEEAPPGEDRARIFARFERGPSARGIAGHGIGLWVVRHLIQAHGGRVDVRSRPGKWTVFDVFLPQLSPQIALYPASASLSTSSFAAPALDRRGSKGPMRRSPLPAAKRTRSPTL